MIFDIGLALVSINKAKGLDSLAVIMIDIERFDKLSKPQEQMNYFTGATGSGNCWRFFIELPRSRCTP